MLRFAIIRVTESLIVLLLVSFAVYGLIGLMPGDPIDIMVQSDPDLTPADAARLKALYGLDQPIIERYGNWLAAAMQGDFGNSRVTMRPVMEMLWPRLGNSLLLLGISTLLALAIAIPIGVYAAARPYSLSDYLVNLGCFAGISVPPFWLALLMMILFSVTLGWLPAGGMGPVGDDSWSARLPYLVLPVMTLTIGPPALSRASRDDADHRQRRRLYALHARQHAADPAPGFHPHRARQGPGRDADSLGACPAERDNAAGHRAGA
jgi:peptide/nickel transport system permease protein